MNKRNLIYKGLLMLAMVTSPVSAKETSVSVVHGTANFNEGNASIVIQANQNQPKEIGHDQNRHPSVRRSPGPDRLRTQCCDPRDDGRRDRCPGGRSGRRGRRCRAWRFGCRAGQSVTITPGNE